MKKRILLVALSLALALSLACCGGNPTKEEMLENAESVSIDCLEEDFRNNMVTAREKYTGKAFVVPGKVKEIKEDSCILSNLKSGYYVKVDMSLEELKNFNRGDIIYVVGMMTGDVETEEHMTVGNTFTDHYFVMGNAYFVSKITEVRGRVHKGCYIEAPFLAGDSTRIYLVSNRYDLPKVGTKVAIPASDIEYSSLHGYDVLYTPYTIKIEK